MCSVLGAVLHILLKSKDFQGVDTTSVCHIKQYQGFTDFLTSILLYYLCIPAKSKELIYLLRLVTL